VTAIENPPATEEARIVDVPAIKHAADNFTGTILSDTGTSR